MITDDFYVMAAKVIGGQLHFIEIDIEDDNCYVEFIEPEREHSFGFKQQRHGDVGFDFSILMTSIECILMDSFEEHSFELTPLDELNQKRLDDLEKGKGSYATLILTSSHQGQPS